jgi:Lipase (class 3)
MGVVLAFRGTLMPPVSPHVEQGGPTREAIARFNGIIPENWRTFLEDWGNNFVAVADSRNRHLGFDESWNALRAHLARPCSDEDAENCSKFTSFLAPQNGVKPKLFVTGHSKGGALATLAGLDLRDAAPWTAITVHAFAAPKSLTKSEALNQAEATKAFWRFERESDLVPTLPADDSMEPASLSLHFVGQIAPYAHVGLRALFDKNGLSITTPENGRDAPKDDLARWIDVTGAEKDAVFNWIAAKALGEKIPFACPLINDHFGVFADVQAQAWAADSSTPGDGDLKKRQFFQHGLAEEGVDVMPGYEDWCGWLNAL